MSDASEGMYYSLQEVTRMLGMNERTIRRWIKSGRLPAYKPGGREFRIAHSDLMAFMEKHRERPPLEMAPHFFKEGREDADAAVVSALRDRIDDHIGRWTRRSQYWSGVAGAAVGGDVLRALFDLRSDATRGATYIFRDMLVLGASMGAEDGHSAVRRATEAMGLASKVPEVIRVVTDLFRAQVDRIELEQQAAHAELLGELLAELHAQLRAEEELYTEMVEQLAA